MTIAIQSQGKLNFCRLHLHHDAFDAVAPKHKDIGMAKPGLTHYMANALD